MSDNEKLKLIEIHQHLGPCNVFDINVTKEEIIKVVEDNNIDICIIQLFPGVNDYVSKNNDIIELCKEHKGKFYGLIDINPHLDEIEYDSEVKRLMKTGLFKAIKLHTIGHAVNPLSKDADKVYRSAKKYGIPVMVHTGAGIPFALPSLIIPKAREYRDVNFIIAHSGNFQIYSAEAYVAATVCENIFLETSWTSVGDKAWFIDALGSERILFGADIPGNIAFELYQYKNLNIKNEDLENIFYNNAKKLLNL